MIASIVWDVDPILFKVGSWEVRWYGLMWGLGFILAYEMVSRLFKKEKYPEEWVDKLFVYCIVSTVIGEHPSVTCQPAFPNLEYFKRMGAIIVP